MPESLPRFPTTVVAALQISMLCSLDYLEDDNMAEELAHVQNVLARTLAILH